MHKERVLIINCHTERSHILSDSLSSQGYEVIELPDLSIEQIQRQIHIYHPDYLVLDDDELISLSTH